MKNLKTIVVGALCIVTLLTFVGCQASQSDIETSETVSSTSEIIPAEKETTEQTEPKISTQFDVDLFGRWTCVEIINNGDDCLVFNKSLDELGILPDGTFFWVDRVERYDGGIKATTNGNKIENLLEAAWQQDIAAGNISEDVPEPDWEMIYEIIDIQEPSTLDDRDGFYQKDKTDKLVLSIKGTIQESPVKTSNIDATIIFEKHFPMFSGDSFTEACLLGEWTDSQGNTWKFSYSDTDQPELVYTLKTPNGLVYNSKGFFHGWSADDASEYFDFRFDNVDLGEMTILSCNGNEFVFAVDGDELVLTKKQ